MPGDPWEGSDLLDNAGLMRRRIDPAEVGVAGVAIAPDSIASVCILVETVDDADADDTARIRIPIRSDAIEGRCCPAKLNQRAEVLGRVPS